MVIIMEYEIKGGPFPIVICYLKNGEKMKTESGGMALMTPRIKMETTSDGGIIKGLGRALSGESMFLTYYTAEDDGQHVGFASTFPGKIIPLNISEDRPIIAQKSAFLAGEEGVDIKMHFRKNLGAGLFGGEGFILQKISGNGVAFLEIDGDILEYDLKDGEELVIDQGHLGAMDETVSFDIQRVKGAKNMLLSGEGVFLARLTGPGKVWIQTMPLPTLAGAIIPYLPTKS